MNQTKVKELAMDILVDVVAGMVIAIGVYNFALNANFPVAGFSGIAIILYHLFRIPATLTLEQQAYFALGYRQMCTKLQKDKNERIEKIKNNVKDQNM